VYCQAPNMLDCMCRRRVACPAAVSPITAGQPLMLHGVPLWLVNLR